jgi:hypothetical protein
MIEETAGVVVVAFTKVFAGLSSNQRPSPPNFAIPYLVHYRMPPARKKKILGGFGDKAGLWPRTKGSTNHQAWCAHFSGSGI